MIPSFYLNFSLVCLAHESLGELVQECAQVKGDGVLCMAELLWREHLQLRITLSDSPVYYVCENEEEKMQSSQ